MTDRREEDHVPQFHGRIDEKFAEWVIDVKLWEAELKEEDRDRQGPKLYQRDENIEPHRSRNFWNEDHHTGASTTHAGQESDHSDDCCKET